MTTPDPYGQINPQPTWNPQYPAPAAPPPTQQAYGMVASSQPPTQQGWGVPAPSQAPTQQVWSNPAYPVSPAPPGYGYPPTAPPAAERDTLVFVVSVIMIAVGASGFVSNLSTAGFMVYHFGGIGALSVFLGAGVTIAEVTAGILGVRWASIPSKGQLLFTVGLVMLGFAIARMIVILMADSGFGLVSIFALALPVLFLFGAHRMRQRPR